MEFDPAGIATAAEATGHAAPPPALHLGRPALVEDAARFDEQLQENGLQDGAASTRHFTDDTAPTMGRFGGPLNQHVTPLDGGTAHVLTSVGAPEGPLEFARPEPMAIGRADMGPAAAVARAFEPDSGTVTPQGRHLTEQGETRVVEQHQADETTAPGVIAAMRRVPLE